MIRRNRKRNCDYIWLYKWEINREINREIKQLIKDYNIGSDIMIKCVLIKENQEEYNYQIK